MAYLGLVAVLVYLLFMVKLRHMRRARSSQRAQ